MSATKCPTCGTANPTDSKYCKECATKIDFSERATYTKTLETTTDELPRGTVFAGRYEIIEELGRGGMGRVYRAEDTKVGGEIALKIIVAEISADKRAIDRFRSELKTTRMISHRNVCRMFDLGEDNGAYFIAMEFVPGEDLKSFIRRVGLLPAGKAVSIIGQICLGLAEAHRLGVVHRDLKPGNIMIDKEGNAKIMDFGIARSVRAKGITGEGIIIGTPEYMSPEQVEAKDVDQRSDIYALGVILYEMLTGRTPFEGESPLSVALKHKSETPKNPKVFNPQISDGLGRAILRCLEKDKDKRYQTADELRAELEKIDKGVSTPAAAVAKRPLTSRQITVTFGWTKLILPAAVVVLAAAAMWMIFLRSRPGKKSTISPSETPVLVALPARVFGPAEFDYLTEAVPGTLSTFLGQVEGLSVKIPPSSIEVDKVKGDLRIIADLYQVNTFVMTSVTAESGRIYLDVKLADAGSHDQRWSKQFNGASGQYLEMVRSAADEIRQYLRPASPSVLVGEGGLGISEAQLEYRRGQFFFLRHANNHEAKDFEMAMAAYKQAIQLDPKLAIAYAGIAGLLINMNFSTSIERPAYLEIESWARKALEIDPKCSQAWAALSFLEQLLPGYDPKKPLEYALRAAFYGPEDWVAQNQVFAAGQALRMDILGLQEAIRLDPFAHVSTFNLAWIYGPMGRAEESLTILDRIFQIEPDSPSAFCAKAMALIYLGRLREADEPMKRSEELVREKKLAPIWGTIINHLFLIQENDPDKVPAALAEIRKATDEMHETGMELQNYLLFLPPILARHGHDDLAVYILEKGAPITPGVYDLFDFFPDLQRLKGDPRGAKLRARCRPVFEETLRIYIDARRRGELPKYLESGLDEIMKEMNIKLLP